MLLPPLSISSVKRVPVQLTGSPVAHSTSGYRRWAGQFTAPQPIVALVLNVTDSHVAWSRSSHRGQESIETSILFAPRDDDGRRIQVSFSIMEATAFGESSVESVQVQPTPELKTFHTGELIDIARIDGDPKCVLKALFLVRDDVRSVRNGVWHAKVAAVKGIAEPWHTVLTYGRAGEFDVA